jgi:hypothetical protein
LRCFLLLFPCQEVVPWSLRKGYLAVMKHHDQSSLGKKGFIYLQLGCGERWHTRMHRSEEKLQESVLFFY